MISLIEAALNKYLALDPESKNKISDLQGKILKIKLANTGLVAWLTIEKATIKLSTEESGTPDAVITGAPLSLLHLLLAKENRRALFNQNVVIEGDAQLAQSILALFEECDIDWEELLAKQVGDIPAHHVGQWFGSFNRFTEQFRKNMRSNTSEYLQEESKILPVKEEMHDFFMEIDRLRLDVDRVDMRLTQLIESAT